MGSRPCSGGNHNTTNCRWWKTYFPCNLALRNAPFEFMDPSFIWAFSEPFIPFYPFITTASFVLSSTAYCGMFYSVTQCDKTFYSKIFPCPNIFECFASWAAKLLKIIFFLHLFFFKSIYKLSHLQNIQAFGGGLYFRHTVHIISW